MKTAKNLLIVVSLMLAGCSSDAWLTRGDKLLAAGDMPGARAAYQQGLQLHPTSTPLRLHLSQVQGRMLDAMLAQVTDSVDGADFIRAQDLLAQARDFADRCDEHTQRDKIDGLRNNMADFARERARALQSQGDAVRAVALAEATARRFGTSNDDAALRAMRMEGIARYRRAAHDLMQTHPGSAALQLAMAGRLGDTEVQAKQVALLWQRFTRRACYQAPTLDVRVKSGANSADLADALRQSLGASLEQWRESCGRGSNALRVSVDVTSVETDDRSMTAPAAIARPSSQAVVEDSVQVNERIWDTVTTQQSEPRERAVVHHDCRDSGPNHQLACSQWRETVRRAVPIERLKVVQRDHLRTYPHVLPRLHEADVVRFERGMMSRRVVVRGFLQVGNDAPQAFAITVLSEDSGHPEIRRDDVVLPADPLEVQDLPEMVHEASLRVAELAVTATREATFDAAATLADRAAELTPTDPETAEELYLQTLGEGWDGGHGVRAFFLARYGMPADEVLASLNHVLGRRTLPPGATSTADLALFYPRP